MALNYEHQAAAGSQQHASFTGRLLSELTAQLLSRMRRFSAAVQKDASAEKKAAEIAESLVNERGITKEVSTLPQPVQVSEALLTQQHQLEQGRTHSAVQAIEAVLPYGQVNGEEVQYRSERISVQKSPEGVAVTDRQGDTLLVYDNQGEISQNNLTSGQEQTLEAINQNLQGKNLEGIMRDPTGKSQVENLGGLAPEGSHAIAVAHQVIPQGTESARGQNYTFIRSNEGYEVTRNGSGEVIAQSNASGITPGHQTSQDLTRMQRVISLIKTHQQEQSQQQGRER